MDETSQKETRSTEPAWEFTDRNFFVTAGTIAAVIGGLIIVIFAVIWMFPKETSNSATSSISARTKGQTYTDGKRQWYTQNSGHTRCIEAAFSPAERIESLRTGGGQPNVKDLPGGAVEVAIQINEWQEQVFTYYPSMESCEAAFSRSQYIPDRYR
ncbi:MAG: hypothetical protein LBH10_06740 [Burkholderiaceae bacterium]|jgi:hypothetical protein|nr:hypothetical protein [Burkholderiaceae bacterium]